MRTRQTSYDRNGADMCKGTIMNSEINWLGELRDRDAEAGFFESETGVFVKHAKMFLAIAGILYFLFIIPDYFLIKNAGHFSKIFANRVIVVLLNAFLFSRIDGIKNKSVLYGLLTLYEIMIMVSFCVVFYLYENPNFLIQTFGLIICVIIIFVAPNRWMYKNIVALVTYLVFFLLSALYMPDIRGSEFSAGLVYSMLALIFSSLNSFLINQFKRIAYVKIKALELLSNTDPLTGIFNRAKFNSELETYIRAYSAQDPGVISLIIFDIDDFKEINDQYGHLVGDRVLQELADTVKLNIRENDLLFRWGGEEFVVLLKETDKDQAMIVAEKLRKIIDGRLFQGSIHITCSFGVVTGDRVCSVDEFLGRGDKHLYMAKANGKNIVKCND